MKHYINEAEAFLQTSYRSSIPKDNPNPQQGDMIPHGVIVEYAIITIPVNIGRETYLKEVYVYRDRILELAKVIEELQSKTELAPYDNLPF